MNAIDESTVGARIGGSNSLAAARLHWQIGDWAALAALDVMLPPKQRPSPAELELMLYKAQGAFLTGQTGLARDIVCALRQAGVNRRVLTASLLSGAHGNLSRAWMLLGAPERAARAIREAVDLHPDIGDPALVANMRMAHERNALQEATGLLPDSHEQIPGIVFIAGAQRSGTTLVQTLVANALSNSPVLPESHVVCDFLYAYRRSKAEWQKTSSFYGSVRHFARYFRSILYMHFSELVGQYPASNIVLKDPNFSKVMGELSELFPKASQVLCVRDPRDIAASFIRIGQRQMELGEETKYTRRDIGYICKKINDSYGPPLENSEVVDYSVVRYEEMVSNPATTLRRLAAERGLQLMLDRIDAPVWLEAERRHKTTWISELEEQPPTPEHVGSFRHVLRPNEISRIEEACGSIMQEFGYDRDETGAHFSGGPGGASNSGV